MAAPQSVKRGFRRMKGLVLVKQCTSLFGEETLAGGGVDVRFTRWWMGERSDVWRTARERTVEAVAVSKKRNRHRVIIVRSWVCFGNKVDL